MAGRRVGLLHTPIVEPARVDEAVGRPAHSTVETQLLGLQHTATTRPHIVRWSPVSAHSWAPGDPADRSDR